MKKITLEENLIKHILLNVAYRLGQFYSVELSIDPQFFRYWVVVSLFLLVEPLLDLLPLPFLTIGKLVGLAWCLAAEPISGSRILFDQVSPFFRSNLTWPPRSTPYGKRAEPGWICGRRRQAELIWGLFLSTCGNSGRMSCLY